jgi:Flp pilus assembly protein TadG
LTAESTGRSRRRGRRRERGQSLVEFALTAPILIMLLIGLIELGNGLNAYLTVLASARDAARLGAQGSASDTAMANLVQDETDRLSTVIPTSCGGGTAPGTCITHTTLSGVDTVRVEVCYNHPLIVTGLGIIPNPILLCSETAMRVLS